VRFYPVHRALLGLSALAWPWAACASDSARTIEPPLPFISELRGGIFAHDPFSREHGSVDGNAEILFQHLPIAISLQNRALLPRPHMGVTLGKLDKTSHAYVGLSWTFDLSPKMFWEASLGGAIHNGKGGPNTPLNRNPMDCALHFRESLSLGYRLNTNWAVMGTVEHLSNAGLCKQNRGLTNLGARIGYRF